MVIPNWNGLEFLRVVLPSLKKQVLRRFETIVVDNGSTDQSIDYIKRSHPGVKVVALSKNLGFAGGCNRGFQAARGEFVALINNDLELDRRCLAELLKVARAHPKAGSFACKMRQFKQRDRIDEAGAQASWHGVFWARGRGERDRGQYDEMEPVLYGSGGATLYRRKTLQQIGLFDEDFFAYLEDVDWGFRAQLAGWSCLYVPTAVVYHMGGASFKRVSGLAQRLWTRNSQFVVIKNYPLSALVRYLPKLMFACAKTFLGAIKDGWFGTYLRAQLQFWWKLPKMLLKRRRIQARRNVGLDQLNQVIGKRFGLPSKALGRTGRAS